MKTAVLIVEDDQDLGNLLKQYLELNGFSATLSNNGKDARKCLQEVKFDIILSDVMMPFEDGFTFAEAVSQIYPEIPFLFITARKEKEDVLKGLKLGADDYIVKPFDADELVLRIRNILKRTSRLPAEAKIIQFGIYTFIPEELVLESPNGRKSLTERESDLLLMLYSQRGQLIRKHDILNKLWPGNDYFNARSMDVFVSRLRKYLAEDPSITIESIRATGLRLLINS